MQGIITPVIQMKSATESTYSRRLHWIIYCCFIFQQPSTIKEKKCRGPVIAIITMRSLNRLRITADQFPSCSFHLFQLTSPLPQYARLKLLNERSDGRYSARDDWFRNVLKGFAVKQIHIQKSWKRTPWAVLVVSHCRGCMLLHVGPATAVVIVYGPFN